MTPGVVFVAVSSVVWLVARWRRARRRGDYRLGNEWPYWVFAAGSVGVALVLSGSGRLATLIVMPLVLIPGGAYFILKARRGQSEQERRMRLYGWLAVIGGVLGGLAAISSWVVAAS